MSRYIDEEWLEDNAKEYSLGYYADDEWATPLNVLDSAPSIDIVRCYECKHCVPYSTCDGDWQMCMRWEDYSCDVKLNDFCSYGEREGE